MDGCPCCSGKNYQECCGPFIEGSMAPVTPEELMRSRYTAYATDNVSYISKTVKGFAAESYDEQKTAEWARNAEWLGLEIIKADPVSDQDESGFVEFIAKYRLEGQDHDHHEISEFHKIDGMWYFVKWSSPEQVSYVRPFPKTGRNEPCICGSGKKYKKCCGLPEL
ncbi:MAG: YchJ family protein [bacterium]|nr:YchJ family protein [bacterium]